MIIFFSLLLFFCSSTRCLTGAGQLHHLIRLHSLHLKAVPPSYLLPLSFGFVKKLTVISITLGGGYYAYQKFKKSLLTKSDLTKVVKEDEKSRISLVARGVQGLSASVAEQTTKLDGCIQDILPVFRGWRQNNEQHKKIFLERIILCNIQLATNTRFLFDLGNKMKKLKNNYQITSDLLSESIMLAKELESYGKRLKTLNPSLVRLVKKSSSSTIFSTTKR